jgi:PAS domain S-box-containing protein
VGKAPTRARVTSERDAPSDRNDRGAFSSETYRAIFEASPDGVLVVDSVGVIREVNVAAEEVFRYGPGELTEKDVDVLVPTSLRGTHEGHRQRYMDDPRPRPMGIGMELRGLRADGTEIPVEISLSPLVTAEGPPWVIVTVRDVTQRRRLRDFSAGALRASEEERQRIARELHDDTAQRLTSLVVRLKILERSKGEERDRRFQEFRRELVDAAESVRQVARGLRPPELEDAGVRLALMAHARNVQERAGLRVDLEIGPVDDVLAPDAQLVLYRIVQEALSNVLRHSGASSARVEVRCGAERVVAVVEDRGRGFSPGQSHVREGALGLMGMQERAAMVGGDVTIESSPGQGTRVRVTIPVDSTTEAQRV